MTETVVSPEKETAKEKLRKLVEDETKMVKGRFRNYESPGARARVQIKKYKDVPMFDMWMSDGQVVEIPLYVARHLNGVDKGSPNIGYRTNTCSVPIHEWRHGMNDPLPRSELGIGPGGEPNIPVPLVTTKVYRRRFGFDSLEFDLI
jgi:hypothetical protein